MSGEALFLLIATNVLGGSSYAAVAYALDGFSAWGVVFWRTLIGVFLFAPFLPRALRRIRLGPGDWLRLFAVGLLAYAAPLILGVWGQRFSSATNASLLIGIEPVTIVLLSAAFLGEPLTGLKTGAISCGLLGAAFIVLQGAGLRGISSALEARGNAMLFLTGVLWALYSVLGKPVLRKIDPVDFTVVTTTLALGPITLAAWPSLGPVSPSGPSPGALAALAYLGAGVTFFGTITWNKALELVPASSLANFIFLQPLIGVLLGIALKGERLTFWSGLGGALILLGAWGATREADAPAASPAAPPSGALAPSAENVLESLRSPAD